jgi:hypothetical protein
MKKIILDLNVVTNALWKGRGEEAGKRFIERIKKGNLKFIHPILYSDCYLDGRILKRCCRYQIFTLFIPMK